MSLSLALARLAGARMSVLQKSPGDVNKHAAMGGVLLSTSTVAAVSAFFALHSILELPAYAAAGAGLAWGVVIFNLDRLLIVTMTRANGLFLNILAALPRIALAAVIGAIISMPLVLRIFEPEINSELIAMQAETTKANQGRYDEAYRKITELEGEETRLLAVVSGQATATVSDDPDVKAAKSKLDTAEKAFLDANALAQCEFDGKCGTGVPGDGESYRQKKRLADDARTVRDKAQRELDDITAKVTGRLESGAVNLTEQARNRLPQVQAELQRLRTERGDLEKRGNSATVADTGLLARLEALDRITAGRQSGSQAHMALFLLFLCIELLPVIAKLLSGLGPETLYDRMVRRADDGADDDDKVWADRDRDIAEARADQQADVERQRLAAQTTAHARTTQLVADQQLKMATSAIDVWGKVAEQRTKEELHRWYRQHAGSGDPESTTPMPRIGPSHPTTGTPPFGATSFGPRGAAASTPNGSAGLVVPGTVPNSAPPNGSAAPGGPSADAADTLRFPPVRIPPTHGARVNGTPSTGPNP